jgi:hypothetical protein
MEGNAANPIIHTIEGMKTQASRSLKKKQIPASRSWKKSAATPASKSWGEGSYCNISQHPCILEEMQLPEHPVQIMEELQLPQHPNHGRKTLLQWSEHQPTAF